MMIIKDILYYIEEYAVSAFVIALFTGIFSYLLNSQKNVKETDRVGYIKHIIMLMISVGYAYMVVGITFLSRETDSIRYVNMRIFSWFYTNRTIMKYMVENIIMFIPYGIIYGIEHGQDKDFDVGFVIKRAVFTSIVIEICQYMTARGWSEADDVLTNTIGAIIGWEIVRLMIYVLKRKDRYDIKC